MMKLSSGTVHRETLLYAVYYAPRGSNRLYWSPPSWPRSTSPRPTC